ncbi:cytochrome c-type biogenesis protein CcmH [Pelagibacteraceae bacterium]|jgi:cytochrome c-type biogenesis protein CcmH|nr:cytochrome c-type biogenesis protein CcmH [Pelagibacteraceae bacterium]
MKNIIIVLIFVLLASSTTYSETIKKENELEIFKNLRCLVCQGQSIAESNSDFAQTLKLVVKDKVDSGMSSEEIYEFLASKYGDWIVYKPRINLQNILLWVIPYIVLIFGGIVIYMMLKNRQNSKNN